MNELKMIRNRIRNVTPESFDGLALDIFRYQAAHCKVYKQYLELIGKQPADVLSLKDIPFLPIQLFKQQIVQTGSWDPQITFLSSRTTSQTPSQHPVKSIHWYEEISLAGFEKLYGPSKEYCFLALLPGYLERKGSSLVHMVQHFVNQSKYEQSGFFLHDFEKLQAHLIWCRENKIPTILIGVSFALLDFIETHQIQFDSLIVMETGGMKGNRPEITRTELHNSLSKGFGVEHIHSEYGMTELLSQAYAPKKGFFIPNPTMKVLLADASDPLSITENRTRGLLQVIDLANLDSISFIGTQDLGKHYPDGTFEVLGRHDISEVRGCNLMVAF